MKKKFIFFTAILITFSAVTNAASKISEDPFIKAESAYKKNHFDEALMHYQIAANTDNKKALYKLGVMAENGEGRSVSYDDAMKYYKASSAGGDLDGYFGVAYLLEHARGVEGNISEAVKYYTYAAEHNHSKSQHNLAVLLSSSSEATNDYTKACYYYQKAVQNNFNLSYTPLAYLYVNGQGCENDNPKALELFKKSLLAQDDPQAQYNLALMIARGMGTVKNPILAYALWENNAKLGHADSAFNRDVIAKKMSKKEILKAQTLAKDRVKMINMIKPYKKLVIQKGK